MHPQKQQRLANSFWLLQWWDLAPEEFATYLIELGTLALRHRDKCANHETPALTEMLKNQPSA